MSVSSTVASKGNAVTRSRRLNVLGLSPGGVFGLAILLIFLVVCCLAPLSAPYDPLSQSFDRLQSPTAAHPFGTDDYGRDVLSRIIWGGRLSFFVSFVGVGLSTLLGATLGILAGFTGGRTDAVLTRIVDVMLSFPPILVAITVVGTVGGGVTSIILALTFAFTPRIARIIRAEVVTLKEREFVMAAVAGGGRKTWILVRHILPNISSVLLVVVSLELAHAILVEAALSFLGLGSAPDAPTWGRVVSDGSAFVQQAPWISVFAGIVITVVVLAFSLLGDALRDRFDPRLQTKGPASR